MARDCELAIMPMSLSTLQAGGVDVEDPALPPPFRAGQRPQVVHIGRKRSRDDVLSTSSDPPLFSSDDLPPALENYGTSRIKRQYQGPWWSAQGQSTATRRNGGKREFKRNMDSAVWMGSDDTESDQGSEGLTEEHCGKSANTLPPETDAAWQQEEGLLRQQQRFASLEVQRCVEEGIEVVDLADRRLGYISAETIRPLHYLTVQMPDRLPPSQEAYHPLTPSIRLYLANNNLLSLPGELYKLENLTELSLRQNNLTSILPSISNLLNLEELSLSCNDLRYLPWEILDLASSAKLKSCRFLPNPFIVPLSADSSTPNRLDTKVQERGTPAYLVTSQIAYLDINGRPCRNSPPAPSAAPFHKPGPPSSNLDSNCRSWTGNMNHTPSLLEVALRACSASSVIDQLSLDIPEDSPPSLYQLLNCARVARDAGGTKCSVCKRKYIVPRAEWIEWWAVWFATSAVLPLLRRACSWGCAATVERELGPEDGIFGWRVGKENECKSGWTEDHEEGKAYEASLWGGWVRGSTSGTQISGV